MTGPAYTTGAVTSRDGTVIGYRQVGRGPGVIAVHGGMQAAQNLMRLARALAGSFTVYLPDRRGRGLSGPPGDHYGLGAECDDIDALAQATGAVNLFGLSSGAVIALQAASTLPSIRRVAAYEPPISVDRSTPRDWVERYEREVAQGRLGAAAVTAIRGTQTAPPALRLLPRVVLDTMLGAATRVGGDAPHVRGGGAPPDRGPARRAATRALLWPLRQPASGGAPPGGQAAGDVPLRELVPTMHYDILLVGETQGKLGTFAAITAEVLLLGGSKSPAYLKTALDALGGVLPQARRVEFAGCGHLAADNSGEPERVARELRAFFTPQSGVDTD